MSKIFRRFIPALFAVVMALFPCGRVLALSDETLSFYALNNIFYYNPEGVAGCPDYGTITGGQVTWIGDSLSVGAEQYGNLVSNALPGVDLTEKTYNGEKYTHIQVSKSFYGSNADNRTGMEVAEALIDHTEMRDYLVFALGTNNAGGVNADKIKGLMDLVGETKKVVLVTNASDGKSGAPNFNSNNEAIRKAAEDYKNVAVADWAEKVGDNSKGYIDDNQYHVHLTKEGSEVFVDTIKTALSSLNGWSSGGTPISTGGAVSIGTQLVNGSDKYEVAWRWMMTNVPNVTPEFVAGVLGNMYAEGANPLSLGTNYAGLFQWGGGRRTALFQYLEKYSISSADFTARANDEQFVLEVLQREMEFAFTEQDGQDVLAASNDPVNKTGAAGAKSYAELWLVMFERAVYNPSVCGTPGRCDNIQDPGVRPHITGREPYQDAPKRRDSAAEMLEKYAGIGGGSGVCNIGGNGKVAETAMSLAWDCYSGTDSAHCGWGAASRKTPRDEYLIAKREVGLVGGDVTDCGHFVQVVLRYSGVDPNAQMGSGNLYDHYYPEHPDIYTKIDVSSTADLRSGDVMVIKGTTGYGHVKIYVEIDGKGYTAEASKGGHAPWITEGVELSDYRGQYAVYRTGASNQIDV